MTKEKFSSPSEVYDVKTLSAQNKVRMILDIFELGKDAAGNESRKNNFLDLMKSYKAEIDRKSRQRVVIGEHSSPSIYRKQEEDSLVKQLQTPESQRRVIHDQIMDILSKMSLSAGLNSSQRQLVEYLSEDRIRVEEMILAYLGAGPSPRVYSEVQQARRGDGMFTAGGEEN